MKQEFEDVKEDQVEGAIPEKALVEASTDWLHPLEPYAPKQALAEMTRRYMAMDTSKTPLKANEASLVIQMAATTRLNPFAQELWAWVTIYQGKRNLTLMPGRRGLLRLAREQADEKGMTFNEDYGLILDGELRKELAIPEGAVAYECKIRDDISRGLWVKAAADLKGIGMELDQILGQIGDAPFATGYGFVSDAEMQKLNKGGNKMAHAERARKRAFMSALKKKFDLPFGAIGGDQAGLTFEDYVRLPGRGEVVEGEFLEAEESEAPATYQNFSEQEMSARRKPQYWPDGIPEAVVDAGYAKDKYNAAALLSWSPFNKAIKKTYAVNWSREYREIKQKVEDGELPLGEYPDTRTVANAATMNYFANMK